MIVEVLRSFPLERREVAMPDLIFIGILVVFFLISGLYVRFCEKL
jgi:hypothetical protein